MKNANRKKTCCIHCGRCTWNKYCICENCLNGEHGRPKPELLDDHINEDGKRDAFYGFSVKYRGWSGFSYH